MTYWGLKKKTTKTSTSWPFLQQCCAQEYVIATYTSDIQNYSRMFWSCHARGLDCSHVSMKSTGGMISLSDFPSSTFTNSHIHSHHHSIIYAFLPSYWYHLHPCEHQIISVLIPLWLIWRHLPRGWTPDDLFMSRRMIY